MNAVPKRLGRSPLVEAIWELRFEPSVDNAGEYLHGELYRLRGNERPVVQLLAPPGVPPDLLAAIGWSERPLKALRWSDGVTVQFGDRVLTVNVDGQAYGGFETFKSEIEKVLGAIPSDLVKNITRTSLRYINLITHLSRPTLDALQVCLGVGRSGRHVVENVFLRWEEWCGDEIYVHQIGAPATTQRQVQGKNVGIAVDIDAIANDVSDVSLTDSGKRQIVDRVVRIHDRLKERFFDLLRDETLREMDPEWEGGI